MQRALKQAIAERQAQALARRRALGAHLSGAGHALLRQAARPEALALAAGAGFLLGRMRGQGPPAKGRETETTEPREPKTGPLALAATLALRQLGPMLISLWLQPRPEATGEAPAATADTAQPPNA
ncbi:hypothetical protein [Alkalilimnicola sp. S0819]|uniref:hypothetical protein n=1 Tax=Alkalilimnicola sp. S0819 TaxID=2613922 RepID=UPI00126157A1|nr:hypothetical protein [Alkalilimnicola sp. S0819]KAB7627342.1 hypothetical protein F3N43_05365 [Alkalilimnicola sp. S0819]MPQ16059.1 hypothetical protein [Alkalilimnicola sp. S0819]